MAHNVEHLQQQLEKHYRIAAEQCNLLGCEDCDYVNRDGKCLLHNPWFRYSHLDSSEDNTSYSSNDMEFVDELMFLPKTELVALCRDLMAECDASKMPVLSIEDFAEEMEESLNNE